MTTEHISAQEAAALLMTYFERRGATFALDADGFLRANIDRVDFSRLKISPHEAIGGILGLAEEIEAILRSMATLH